MPSRSTPKDIAEWMVQRLEKASPLYQETVVYEIKARFGEEFVRENNSGSLAVSRAVLKQFARLTKDSVVWERHERCWRKREATDPPGCRMIDD
jgi:hypothetical protein